MKLSISFLLILMIVQVHLHLRAEKRQELLSKLTEKIIDVNPNFEYEDEYDLYNPENFKQMYL